MFRARLCAVLGMTLMLISTSAEARELFLALDSRIGGDNNVFRNRQNEKADGYFELRPQFSFRERNSNLNYDFTYRPSYQTYFETTGIDGFDHKAWGTVDWRLTPADTFTASGRYSNTRRLQIEDQTSPSNPIPAPEESDRERLRNADATLSYTRLLTPLLSLQTSASFDDFASNSDNLLDSRSYSGSLGSQYSLDPKTAIGVSAAFRHRESGGSDVQYTTDTNIWDVAASIRRAISPSLTVSLQAGPSFVSSSQKPPSDPAFSSLKTQDTSDISYFASAKLTKEWQLSKIDASYVRSESRGGGSSSSAFVDNVSLDFNHAFDRQWKMRIYGAWTRRREIAAVPGDYRVETTNYQATGTLTRRITPQLSVSGQFFFLNQDQNGGSSSDSIGQIYSGFVSLRYTFEPVVF